MNQGEYGLGENDIGRIIKMVVDIHGGNEFSRKLLCRRGTNRSCDAPWNQKMAQQYWKDLAGEGRKPAPARQTLLGNPEQAVEMLKINLKQVASAKGIAGVLENVIVPVPEDDHEPLDVVPPMPPIMRALQQA